jgi:hypothetical protein
VNCVLITLIFFDVSTYRYFCNRVTVSRNIKEIYDIHKQVEKTSVCKNDYSEGAH